ncbi:Gfo/Idh/MocA family protein [Falsihalocynthiibacter sp. SS001]|uniref:Gfo/Idh/MocA family protein n=1 Tax=Falsihalocynthiibacter sp. SS001 TaxID=3349698 RepID=UPI0036D3BEFF
MGQPKRIAVVGAGLMGRRHVAAMSHVNGVELAAVVEPSPTDHTVPVFGSLDDMFEAVNVDGVILSTPTLRHVDDGMACVDRGVPVLIEKPLAASSDDAQRLINRARERDVPILVGHHRRHNPIIQETAKLIKEGAIGQVRAAHVTCWFYKPDDYFEVAPWRKQTGAGPISVNLVHDVDLMRHFLGEVVTVQAQMAPSVRGFENEDLAAAVLRFESGTVCTITVSDSIVSPWSWELTSREYPIYPTTNESCYLIGGSKGALSIPDMRLWQHEGDTSWWNPIMASVMPVSASDPLINQIAHFEEVIRGTLPPLVSGEEGLKTLRVIEAIQRAAQTQTPVQLGKGLEESSDIAE